MENILEERNMKEGKKERKETEKNSLDEIWGDMEGFVDALFAHHKAEMSRGHLYHH